MPADFTHFCQQENYYCILISQKVNEGGDEMKQTHNTVLNQAAV